MKKGNPTDPVDKAADQMQGNDIDQILPRNIMAQEAQNKDHRHNVDRGIPDKRRNIREWQQVDDDRDQNVFKEKTAVLLRGKKGQAC
ncbi:MAG: hypothetical protein SPE66_05410 [Bilifractor sp.]|nr:hypothetical protein [Bilifractor sp.]